MIFLPVVCNCDINITNKTGNRTLAPPKRDTTGVLVRLHANTLSAIDDLIEKGEGDLSRPEMIRRLLKETLRQQGYDVREIVE
ncbi:MAG: hypothetical protein ABJL57_18825 [Hyphomonas sp.]|uniref:hypothetical protein n=1 Tax=Hyphomonas sp. TaxID=87 RepID=UPI003299714C